jgi:hypothetical protein
VSITADIDAALQQIFEALHNILAALQKSPYRGGVQVVKSANKRPVQGAGERFIPAIAYGERQGADHHQEIREPASL